MSVHRAPGLPVRRRDAQSAQPLRPVVHVGYAVPRRGIPASASFGRWVAAALSAAGHARPAELSIRIVARREGHALNWRYRARDYATDVLSFPVELPAGIEAPLLGDIVICAPVVVRAAREFRLPVRNHYAHLTVHGVLHLLGYDHHKRAEFAVMKALEIRALASLGIADPYRSLHIG
ncbi:MAG TPA: rRNA maturation RNase YbeY [Rhodanobacteraceae bacterium]